MSFISKPMGYVMRWLATLCGGNFAGAVFLFTLLVNLVIFPLTLKSQKSSAKQALLKPKMDMLRQKYGDDKQKYNAALQELYQRENVSMAGGCLPMIIRLLFMYAIYFVVVNPLQYLGGIPADTINAAMKDLGVKSAIELVAPVAEGKVASIPADTLSHINFNFFGIDLTDNPNFTFNFSEAEPIWIIPFLAFATAMLTSIISLVIQKKQNPGQPTMAGMLLTMPVISLIIGFTVPGALGFYWACSSLISGGLQTIMQLAYSPEKMVSHEQMKFVLKRNETEKKILAEKAKQQQ